jgi:hypothetical protein
VEQYYINSGFLIPSFHKSYWLGLRVTDDAIWPNFTWADGSAAPSNKTWQHWGRWLGWSITNLEPNNMESPEYCAGGAASRLCYCF